MGSSDSKIPFKVTDSNQSSASRTNKSDFHNYEEVKRTPLSKFSPYGGRQDGENNLARNDRMPFSPISPSKGNFFRFIVIKVLENTESTIKVSCLGSSEGSNIKFSYVKSKISERGTPHFTDEDTPTKQQLPQNFSTPK